MSYYFQPQNLLSTFGKQSNGKYSKSLSSKTNIHKNIFANQIEKDKGKQNYQKIIKQRYQKGPQIKEKYSQNKPRATDRVLKNNQTNKQNLQTNKTAKLSFGKQLTKNMRLLDSGSKPNLNRIQSIDKLNCRINLAIQDIAISICKSKCKSKSQLQVIKKPLKQIDNLQFFQNPSCQNKQSIIIHAESRQRQIQIQKQISMKSMESKNIKRQFLQNQNLQNLVSQKQKVQSKFDKYQNSKSNNHLSRNTSRINNPLDHVRSSFSIQVSFLKQSSKNKVYKQQSEQESSFDADLISDKLRQISNKIHDHQKNMSKFNQSRQSRDDHQDNKTKYAFLMEEDTQKKIMPASLVNSRKKRLKTTECYPSIKTEFQFSNHLKTNKKSNFFEDFTDSRSKIQMFQNKYNKNNLNQFQFFHKFKQDVALPKKLKTQQNNFQKIGLKRKSTQNHSLIRTLFKQIQLDYDLRYTKHMFFGTNLDMQEVICDQKSNYKWKVLAEQLSVNGLDLTLNEVKQIFMPKKDQIDPFMSVSHSHQELVHSLIYAYETAQIHWQKYIYQKWQYWDLRQIQLTIENIDRDRKGFISVEDLTTFINIAGDTQYRNRDLILIFNRFLNNRDTRSKVQQSEDHCQSFKKLRFKIIVGNLIKASKNMNEKQQNLNDKMREGRR